MNVKVHSDATASADNRPKNEPSDLEPRAVLIGAAAIVAMVLLAAGIATVLVESGPPTRNAPANLQVARATRLSSDPGDEIAAYNREKQSRLESYGWVDRQQGIAHVPIERAMQMLAEQGSGRAQQ